MTDRIAVETKGADELLAQLIESPKHAEKSTRETANAVMLRLQKRITGSFAENVGVAQRGIRYRIRYASARKRGVGRTRFARVWVGLNPLDANRRIFGRLKQEERGAWARDYYFEGAFVARMRSGYLAIFKRRGEGRLPLEQQQVEVDQPAMRADIESDREQAEALFLREVVAIARHGW